MADQDAGQNVKTTRLLFLDDRNISRSDNAVIKIGDTKKYTTKNNMENTDVLETVSSVISMKSAGKNKR